MISYEGGSPKKINYNIYEHIYSANIMPRCMNRSSMSGGFFKPPPGDASRVGSPYSNKESNNLASGLSS